MSVPQGQPPPYQAPPAPRKRAPRWRLPLLGCGGLLALVCVLGAIMAAVGGGGTATATPQSAASNPTAANTTVAAAATQVTPTATAKPAPTEKPPTATPTPKPTPTVPAPSAAPVNQPTTAPSNAAAAFKTGGLGKTRADWEKVYQKPEKENSGLFTYANGNYLIGYVDDRLAHLEHSWGDQNAKSREFAEGAATPFLPADRKKVREYKSTRSGSTVVLYHSDGLAALFAPESFIGGEPGDFVVIYRDITGKVSGFVIGLGGE